MKLIIACFIALCAAPVEAQQVRRDVTIAMVDTLRGTNIAIVVHRTTTQPADVILLSERAGPRELAAGMAVYRALVRRNEDARVTVKRTRGLLPTLDNEERQWLTDLLVQVRQSTPQPLPDLAISDVRQTVYTYYVRK